MALFNSNNVRTLQGQMKAGLIDDAFTVHSLYVQTQNVVNSCGNCSIMDARKSSDDSSNVCPNCDDEVMTEPDHFYGFCENCEYVFCTNCKDDYHGFTDGCQDNTVQDTVTEFPDDQFNEMYEMMQELAFEEKSNGSNTSKVNSKNQVAAGGVAAANQFECIICFGNVDNSKQAHFGCDHKACGTCVKSYFEVQIKDGNVHGFKCAEPKCGVEASLSLVKQVVDDSTFLRYDELLLGEVLGDLPEIVTCPHCQGKIVAQPEFAFCNICDYRFCTGCMQAFHGLTDCGKSDADRKQDILEYLAADAKQKEELEKREVERRKTNDNNESEQKSEGCHHMQCTRCNTHFCWLCLSVLDMVDPYRHFNTTGSRCVLFLH